MTNIVFTSFTSQELEALVGLNDFQVRLYMLALRPHMDAETRKIGILHRVTYSRLLNAMRIDRCPGTKTRAPAHREQVKRALKALARAGLLLIQTEKQHLILECVLAGFLCASPEADRDVEKKGAVRSSENNKSAYAPNTLEEPDLPWNFEDEHERAEEDTEDTQEESDEEAFMKADQEALKKAANSEIFEGNVKKSKKRLLDNIIYLNNIYLPHHTVPNWEKQKKFQFLLREKNNVASNALDFAGKLSADFEKILLSRGFLKTTLQKPAVQYLLQHWEKEALSSSQIEMAMNYADLKLGRRPDTPEFYRRFVEEVQHAHGKYQRYAAMQKTKKMKQAQNIESENNTLEGFQSQLKKGDCNHERSECREHRETREAKIFPRVHFSKRYPSRYPKYRSKSDIFFDAIGGHEVEVHFAEYARKSAGETARTHAADFSAYGSDLWVSLDAPAYDTAPVESEARGMEYGFE